MNVPDVPKKVKHLINHIKKEKHFSNNELEKLLNGLKLEYADLEPYHNFNHPEDESYGRFVLYNSPQLEVVVMSWKKGDYTAIHDHGQAQWGAVLIFGQVEHTSFELVNDNLIISKLETLKDGQISLVSNQLIHQMGNPFENRAVSLHVYGTDTVVDEVTGEAKNYDPIRKKVFYANGGAFLEIPKKNIVKEEVCPVVQDEIFHNSVKILLNFRRFAKKQNSSNNKVTLSTKEKNIKHENINYL